MKKRNHKQQAYFTLAIVIVALVLINIISLRIFDRYDFTRHEVFTLSEISKDIVVALNDRIDIKVFFTEDVPAPYNNNRRMLIDMLDEYKAYGGSKINFQFISPSGEQEEEEAKSHGIVPVNVEVIENDKVSVKRAYMGLVVFFEDREEVIPFIQSYSDLEYSISAAIKRIQKRNKPVLAYTIGANEFEIESMRGAYLDLYRHYEILPVNLADSSNINEKADILYIIDPKLYMEKNAKKAIDDFLMRGGKLAVMAGKLKIDPSLEHAVGQMVDMNLDDMLANYGIKIRNDVVRDAQCADIMASSETINTTVPFPYMPMVSNFSRNNIISKGLNNVIFQFPSSIDTSLAKEKNIDCEVIAYTSNMSASQYGEITVDPFYNWRPHEFPEKRIPLAALYKGKFKSFYSDKTSPETKIIVVGSGQFMLDEIVERNLENLSFFSNITDYLADDSDLINIRSKNVSTPLLDEVSEDTKAWIKYSNIFGPPLIVVLLGLIVWQRKTSRKKKMEQKLNK